MPTTYTHYCFGEQCKALLPKSLREAAEARPSLWNFGVQGPDILFYNLFFWKASINRKGVNVHRSPGKKFFSKAKQVLEKLKEKQMDGLIYLMAFISHFALDSTAHPYIERKAELSSLSHNRIEAQYEAHILRMKGVEDPQAFRRATIFSPNIRDAKLIAKFLDESPLDILGLMRSYVMIMALLRSPTDRRRKVIYSIGRALPLRGHLEDLLMDNAIDEEARDSNMRLDKLFSLALDRFQMLFKNFLAFLKGEADLNPYFQRTFGKTETYELIPILPVEEEIHYKVSWETGI